MMWKLFIANTSVDIQGWMTDRLWGETKSKAKSALVQQHPSIAVMEAPINLLFPLVPRDKLGDLWESVKSNLDFIQCVIQN